MARPAQVKSLRERLVIADEEREELFEEVVALEKDLAIEAGLVDVFVRIVSRLNNENHELKAQLAEWERLRTSGGPHRGYDDANWVNVAASRVSSADDPDAPPLRRNLA